MKKNIIYLVILVSLAILYLISTRESKGGDDKLEKSDKKLFAIKSDDITSIEVNIEGRKVICKKEDGKWAIVFPKKLAIDKKSVTSFIDGFVNISTNKSFTVKSFSDYGLDKSNIFYKVRTKDNKDFSIIRGDKAPDGYSYYTKTNSSSTVHIISQYDLGENKLGKSLKDFRDKDFLKLSEDNVIEVRLNNIRLNKDKDKWIIQNENKFNEKNIKEYINNILNVKAIGFIDKKGEQKNIFFNKKVLTIAIKTKIKSYKLSITENSQKVYVRVNGDKTIYEVPFYIYASLNKTKGFFLGESDKKTSNKKDGS